MLSAVRKVIIERLPPFISSGTTFARVYAHAMTREIVSLSCGVSYTVWLVQMKHFLKLFCRRRYLYGLFLSAS